VILSDFFDFFVLANCLKRRRGICDKISFFQNIFCKMVKIHHQKKSLRMTVYQICVIIAMVPINAKRELHFIQFHNLGYPLGYQCPNAISIIWP
jgi:hypothetical protein